MPKHSFRHNFAKLHTSDGETYNFIDQSIIYLALRAEERGQSKSAQNTEAVAAHLHNVFEDTKPHCRKLSLSMLPQIELFNLISVKVNFRRRRLFATIALSLAYTMEC